MPELATLAGIALKTCLLIVTAALLSLALRRQSAALRHIVWTAALALCVLMPAAVFLLPSHAVATLPAHAVPTLALPSAWIAWILGGLVFFARDLLSSYGLVRRLRHAHALQSPRWAATLAKFDCRVRVLESTHIASPCTWGVLSPVLLLPTAGDAWSESARHSALLHELAHVQRRDTISVLVARAACVLHWYNPLVWLAAARARNLQERACDDAVLRAGATPSDYAQFLLDVAARMSGMDRRGCPAIGMTHSSLRGRIVAILDPRAARARAGRSGVLACCGTMLTVTLLLGMASVDTVPRPPAVARLPTLPILPTLPVKPVAPMPPVPVVPTQPHTPVLSSAP